MSKDLNDYATAKPTATMEAFADFVIAEVFGGTLPKGVSEASLRKGIALGGSLRQQFQKSDFWKNDDRNYLANVDARRAAKAAEAAEKAEAARVKAIARAEAAKAKADALLAKANAALAANETDAETDAEDKAEAKAEDKEAA